MASDPFIDEYCLFVEKVRTELRKYHKGRGISLLEGISEIENQSIFSCLNHTKQMMKVLSSGSGLDWVDKILKKSKSWMRIFEYLAFSDSNELCEVADSVIDGTMTLEEAISYAG